MDKIETIDDDARQLLYKILQYTAGENGKATIIWDSSLKQSKRNIFPYKFEKTLDFLLKNHFILSCSEIEVSNRYLYGERGTSVEIDAANVRKFLNKQALEKPTEKWDSINGTWTIKISNDSLIIKIGKKNTATNLIFSELYKKKNHESNGKALIDLFYEKKADKSKKTKLGTVISSIRKSINKELGEKHRGQITLTFDRINHLYILKVNFL